LGAWKTRNLEDGRYVGWIKWFIYFHGTRHPAEMGAEEVRQFISHLALDRHVAASTQHQAFNPLIFLYHEVLQIGLRLGMAQGDFPDSVKAHLCGPFDGVQNVK
jgi:hypothetical protein